MNAIEHVVAMPSGSTDSGPSANSRICLLVLGMHRSGTSALTRVLNLAGAQLPEHIMGAGRGNELGHWESNVITAKHDRLLEELGSVWRDWRPIDLQHKDGGVLAQIKEDMRQGVAEEFGDAPFFVVKDPRICRFAGTYIEALEEGGISVRAVLPIRNPLETCDSLHRRDGIPRAQAALIWLRHVLEAERATRGHGRKVIEYADFLGDWRKTLTDVSAALKLDWPISLEKISSEVNAFLSPDQRHHHRNADDFLGNEAVNGWIAEAYTSLVELVTNPLSHAAMDKLDQIRREFDRATPLFFELETTFQHAITEPAELKAKHSELQAVDAAVQAKYEQLLLSALVSSRDEVRSLAASVSELHSALGSSREEIRSIVEELSRLRVSLDAARVPRLRQLLRIRTRAKGAVSKFQLVSQPALQKGGRALLSVLPMTTEEKVKVKKKLLDVFGKAFGIRRGYIDPLAVHALGDLTIAVPGDRYRTLAWSATGAPAMVPPRTVSIIIPVYNQIEYTLACIEAIKQNTADIEHEIIVVDDCSSDSTSVLLKHNRDITYIRNEKNLGFIGACNRGASEATKNYVCFLNNDTKVLPNWLSTLVNTFELHEHVGLVGSKLIYPDGRLQEAGGLIWNDGSGWNWGRLQNPADHRYNYTRLADYCSGASIVLPKALFDWLEGFDPHYTPAYGEDSDLAFKVRSLGLSTLYQPLSQVIHYEGITSGTDLASGAKKHQIVNAQKLAERWAPALRHQGASGVDPDIVSDRGVVGRILVLDQITPEPDRDAGSITALEIMRALRDIGFKVTFVPCSNFAWLPPYSELLAALGIESIIFPWAESLSAHLSRFGLHYDSVLIFRPRTWHDCIDLIKAKAPQARVIYHASDLHFLREERERLLAEKAGQEPAGHKLESSKQAELNIVSTADLCIVHSRSEQDLLQELRPSSRVVCFPWIYEPRGKGPDFAGRKDTIFVGGYGHPPNVDAAEYYIRDIFPLVQERLLGGCKFIAAGSFPPTSLKAQERDDIQVPGFVEDISPLLFNSRVMVVPLRYGAGIKGKIVAALAHGLPVVTTSLGAEGMGLVHEEHVLIADSEADFAAAVERLYTDEALWRRLRDVGLDYVHRTTSREAGLKIVRNMIEQVGLPQLPVPAHRHRDGTPVNAFGSSPVMSDIALLAEAGKAQFAREGSGRIVFDAIAVPDVVAEEFARSEGPAVFSISRLCAAELNLKNLLVVADSTDIAAVSNFAAYCKKHLPTGANAVVVFAAPRLKASADGYAMVSPFSNLPVEPQREPVHERWNGAFAGEELRCDWTVDKSLLGFPSLTVLQITRA